MSSAIFISDYLVSICIDRGSFLSAKSKQPAKGVGSFGLENLEEFRFFHWQQSIESQITALLVAA